MAVNNSIKDSGFNKYKKALILETIRMELIKFLEVIQVYSKIIESDLSSTNQLYGLKLEVVIAGQHAIKHIAITAQSLCLKINHSFTLALIENDKSKLDLFNFLASLQHTLLRSLYEIIAYHENVTELDIYNLGYKMHHNINQIYDAANLCIRQIKKLYHASESKTPFSSFEKSIKALKDALSVDKNRKERSPSSLTIAGKLLVIEEDPMMQDLYKRQIEFFGYQVIISKPKKNIIGLIKKNDIDIILLKLLMINTNSFTLLSKIYKQISNTNIPILVISPLINKHVIKKSLARGAVDFIKEPLEQEIFKTKINNCIERKKLLDREQEYLSNINTNKNEAEKALYSTGEICIAKQSNDASILFADIADFTKITDQLSPQKTVRLLNILFSAFDAIVDKHNIEKIKTIGDNYMALSGLPKPNHHHAEALADAALDMMATVKNINDQLNLNIKLRIGINSGPVVAGLIGTKKATYDVWGKTVNIASRIESQGVAGKIQVSNSTYELIKNNYELVYRGEIDIKGIGLSKTYFLLNKLNKAHP